jgi:hypothetical protein
MGCHSLDLRYNGSCVYGNVHRLLEFVVAVEHYCLALGSVDFGRAYVDGYGHMVHEELKEALGLDSKDIHGHAHDCTGECTDRHHYSRLLESPSC